MLATIDREERLVKRREPEFRDPADAPLVQKGKQRRVSLTRDRLLSGFDATTTLFGAFAH
jgi:hypothetical protein